MMVSSGVPRVYKICPASDWQAAVAAGAYAGSADDRRDGFVHLSSAAQLRQTAQRHFTRQSGLVVIAFDAASLGPDLRWEPSRGGELFPHLYAALPAGLALWVRPAPLDATGVPLMPDGVE